MNLPDDSGKNFSSNFYEFLLPNLFRSADERTNLRDRNFKVARAGKETISKPRISLVREILNRCSVRGTSAKWILNERSTII